MEYNHSITINFKSRGNCNVVINCNGEEALFAIVSLVNAVRQEFSPMLGSIDDLVNQLPLEGDGGTCAS